MKIRNASAAAVSIGAIKVRDGSGLRSIARVKVRDAANVLRTVFQLGAGGLTVSPGYAQGLGASAGTIYVTSNTVYILGVPSGATIVWFIDNPDITIVSPSSSSTVFRAHLASGVTETGTAYATVNGVATQEVVVELTNGGIA